VEPGSPASGTGRGARRRGRATTPSPRRHAIAAPPRHRRATTPSPRHHAECKGRALGGRSRLGSPR
jgi:hypothetical protein